MYQLIENSQQYDNALRILSAGIGPLAIDAERASRFRYDQQYPWLIQVFRRRAGCFLIDTSKVRDLSALTRLSAGQEVILHAAINDLVSLQRVNLLVERLFDTEIAGRLLNLPRVNLGAVLEQLLGVTLKKEYAAVDWSTRPMPTSWLEYAANDVLYLVDLRDKLYELLETENKLSIAAEEFNYLLQPKSTAKEPWRSVKGLHVLKKPVQLEAARQLWHARDQIAAQEDRFSPYVLSDQALLALAAKLPLSLEEISAEVKTTKRCLPHWQAAIQAALNQQDLPEVPTRKRPDSLCLEELASLRQAAENCAQQLNVPLPTLVTMETLRTLARNKITSLEQAESALFEAGLRTWQVQVLAEPLLEAITTPETVPAMADGGLRQTQIIT